MCVLESDDFLGGDGFSTEMYIGCWWDHIQIPVRVMTACDKWCKCLPPQQISLLPWHRTYELDGFTPRALGFSAHVNRDEGGHFKRPASHRRGRAFWRGFDGCREGCGGEWRQPGCHFTEIVLFLAPWGVVDDTLPRLEVTERRRRIRNTVVRYVWVMWAVVG